MTENRNMTLMRPLIIEIARLWPGHAGVNYDTTSDENLLSLIKDAVEFDRKKLMPPWRLTRHLPGFRPLRDGEEWHRQDFSEDMLAGGRRPLLKEELIQVGDEYLQESQWIGVWKAGNASSFYHWHTRTRRPLPGPAKVVPWDGPEDVPLNCWFRHKNSGNLYWASSIDCAGVFLSYGLAVHYRWVILAEAYDHSTDRINWKPCTKEVAP